MDMRGKSLEIFCCYAREDQDLLLELKKHLSPLQREGRIILWADTDINAGKEWEYEVHRHLNTSQIILLLISSNFVASDYCYSIEMQRALERHDCGEARVIPIILSPVDWQEAPFSKLQVLPENATPVKSAEWYTRDDAFLNITKGIRKVVFELTVPSPIESVADPPV